MPAAQERELKLEAPETFSLARLDIRIEPYSVRSAASRRLHTIYHDTADFRLTRWGVSLRYRFGDGWTLKLPQAHPNDAAVHRMQHTFNAGAERVPMDALRLVAGILRNERVLPVIELRTLRTSRHVFLRDREIAEIVEDDVRVVRPANTIRRFRQIEIELAHDAPNDALAVLARGLRRYGAGKGRPPAKIVLALGQQAPPSELSVKKMGASDRAGAVAQAALAASVEELVALDSVLRAGMNPEAVHDARVAVRRLRSHFRTFEPVFDLRWSQDLRSRLRLLGDAFGAARDADVLLHDIVRYAAALSDVDRRAVDRVQDELRASRDRRYAELAASLSNTDYLALLDALMQAARAPQFSALADASAVEVLPEVYLPVWKRLRKRVHKVGRVPQDRDLHQVRIQAKNARYAAEALTGAAGAKAARLAACLEDLQTLIGSQHDAVNACSQLQTFAEGSPYAFVIGELVANAYARAAVGREAWRAKWKAARRRFKRWAI